MIIDDRVYGKEEIDDPALIDLINSGAVQRLKGISQYGLPEELAGRKIFCRYEHSLGVMLLLRRIGAIKKEQIAGLTHDVSHTAFSHLIDWVMGDPTKENYQDNSHSKIIEKSDIPKILEKHGLDYLEFTDYEKFGLLERETPELCADRIDYSLRDAILFGSREKVDFMLEHLKSFEEHIVFDNVYAAKLFGKNFVSICKGSCHGDNLRARYAIFSDVLKKGLELGLLRNEDFRKTDCEIIEVLDKSEDKYIKKGFELLRNGFRIEELNSNEEGTLLVSKFRYVDPEVLMGNKIKKLSELSHEYADILEKEKREIKNRRVRIVEAGR